MATENIKTNESRVESVIKKVSSEDQKIVVIPDVHYNFAGVRRILEKESDYDRLVFLGDFFDFWDDGPEDMQKAIFALQNLCFELENDNKKFHILWGNHDLSYAWGSVNPNAICSGWTREKQKVADHWMMPEDWDRFQWFLFVDDDILLTHAGLSGNFVDNNWNCREVRHFLGFECNRADERLLSRSIHWIYGIHNMSGGILWNRPNHDDFYFEKIKGLRQVFGHTFQKDDPWIEDGNYCIDTGLKHYVVIENNKIEVRKRCL